MPVPVLPSLSSTLTSSIVGTAGSSFSTGEEIGGPGSLWVDEEDKRFYEELRELRGEVPGSVLGLAMKQAESSATEDAVGKELEGQTEEEKERAAEARDAEMEAAAELECALSFSLVV